MSNANRFVRCHTPPLVMTTNNCPRWARCFCTRHESPSNAMHYIPIISLRGGKSSCRRHQESNDGFHSVNDNDYSWVFAWSDSHFSEARPGGALVITHSSLLIRGNYSRLDAHWDSSPFLCCIRPKQGITMKHECMITHESVIASLMCFWRDFLQFWRLGHQQSALFCMDFLFWCLHLCVWGGSGCGCGCAC